MKIVGLVAESAPVGMSISRGCNFKGYAIAATSVPVFNRTHILKSIAGRFDGNDTQN